MSFEAKIMPIIEKNNLLRVDRYAYRKSKKGNLAICHKMDESAVQMLAIPMLLYNDPNGSIECNHHHIESNGIIESTRMEL